MSDTQKKSPTVSVELTLASDLVYDDNLRGKVSKDFFATVFFFLFVEFRIRGRREYNDHNHVKNNLLALNQTTLRCHAQGFFSRRQRDFWPLCWLRAERLEKERLQPIQGTRERMWNWVGHFKRNQTFEGGLS